MSNVSTAELVAYFTDYETTAPKDGRAVRVAVCAEMAWITVGHFKEERGTDTFTADDNGTVGVDVELLYQTLGAMIRRDDRRANDAAKEGELQPNHPLATAVPVTAFSPATRRRA